MITIYSRNDYNFQQKDLILNLNSVIKDWIFPTFYYEMATPSSESSSNHVLEVRFTDRVARFMASTHSGITTNKWDK